MELVAAGETRVGAEGSTMTLIITSALAATPWTLRPGRRAASLGGRGSCEEGRLAKAFWRNRPKYCFNQRWSLQPPTDETASFKGYLFLSNDNIIYCTTVRGSRCR